MSRLWPLVLVIVAFLTVLAACSEGVVAQPAAPSTPVPAAPASLFWLERPSSHSSRPRARVTDKYSMGRQWC